MAVAGPEAKARLLELIAEKQRRLGQRKFWTYYPDEGPLRRELYPKHMEFFAAGKTERERLFLAANRVGKTEGAGGYELTCHLTGLYPDWWEGRVFDRPVDCWASNKTATITRDIAQAKLLGARDAFGTALIPGETLGRTTWKSNVADAVDTQRVKHVSGGWSLLGFKSYDQRRQSYEGTEKDCIWNDEECPLDIQDECRIRTMSTDPSSERAGMIMNTFTPLLGLSELVLYYLPDLKPEEDETAEDLV